MQIKGLIHIHSNFSDGDLSLKEIKIEAQKLGASFVLIADHMEWVDSQEKMNEMVEKCQQLSDKNFLMVPGFERKDDYHFLIYGKADKFLVLAHASHYSKKPPQEILERIDGIEVWNARYDSRYAPNLKALSYLKGGNSVALAGLDAHGIAGLKKIWIEIELEKLGEKEIFNSLREKRFKVANGLFSVDINGPFSFSQRIFFGFVNYFYSPVRWPLVFISRKGIKFPKFLRKIFHKFF